MDELSKCPYHQWTRKKMMKKNSSETEERRESTRARETFTEQMETSFDFIPPTPIGRGRPKLICSCSPKSAGEMNLHVERMTEQQLEKAIGTINEDPTKVTSVNNDGNENQIKTKITEIPNTNERNNNKNNNQIRRSSRMRSNHPIVRFGNPLTH